MKAPIQNIAIIGTGNWARVLDDNFSEKGNFDLRVVGYIGDNRCPPPADSLPAYFPFSDYVEALTEIILQHRLTRIYLVLSKHKEPPMVLCLLTLQNLPVSLKIIPGSFLIGQESSPQRTYSFGPGPAEGLAEKWFRHSGPQMTLRLKRIFDLIVASCLLVLLAPIMLIIAILVRLDSPGPAIYRQQRVGKDGILFWMYKFRTMRAGVGVGADVARYRGTGPGEGAVLAVNHKRPDDPRITRLGRFLRRRSLDELPQLFNVLNGSMSLVGPRPELPEIVQHYQTWQLVRLVVLPGITGWWQVNGRADKPLHQNTEFDLYYISHFSLLLDLKILLRTVTTVIKGTGAY